MKPKVILSGLLTFIPGLYALKMSLHPRKADGGAARADFCWEQWLKHLTFLHRKSGMSRHPLAIAELGPGGSIGVGLAGLLTGAKTLYALDIHGWSDISHNLKVLRELVCIAKLKAPRTVDGWPSSREILGENKFPSDFIPDAVLREMLSDRRIQAIEDQLKGKSVSGNDAIRIRYIAPWNDPTIIEKGSLDLIFSHAVLEHIDDLSPSYSYMDDWLKPGGRISHHIDLTCHGTANFWNGHWSCSDFLWKIIRGKRYYLINRQPCSVHQKLVEQAGFSTTLSLKIHLDSPIGREKLYGKWRELSDDDFRCAGLFLQARKPE